MTLALIKPDLSAVIEYRENSANTGNVAAPHKPYLVPLVTENDLFNSVTQVREEPPLVIIQSNQVIWRYTVRNKTVDEVNAMRQMKMNMVHEQATDRLTPKPGAAGSQQLQALTALVQLLYKYTDRTSWSAADKTTVTNMIKRVQDAQAMRVTEDDKVSELQVLTDPTTIDNYDPTTGWPA